MFFKNPRYLFAIAALSSLGVSNSHGAVTYLLGTNAGRLATNGATGMGDSTAGASGTFSTSAPGGSSGVSFDFSISTTNGGWAPQGGGFGVNGGTAGSGLDNDFGGTGNQETMTFTLSNFSGLAAGESLVISFVELSFGTNAVGETYTLNGGSDVVFTNSPENANVPDGASVEIGAGSAGDTRFAISAFTVEVIPEPSAALLGAIGLVTLLRRRR